MKKCVNLLWSPPWTQAQTAIRTSPPTIGQVPRTDSTAQYRQTRLT
jgi:hypothetical protein